MSFQIGARTFRTADCWFPDGNVVLLVRDVAFKVHRGQLARHSDVFRDMFALPPLVTSTHGSQSRLAESYDGVVHVQMPDSAEELTSFLTMFYDPL